MERCDLSEKGGRVEDRGPISRKFDRSGNGDRNGRDNRAEAEASQNMTAFNRSSLTKEQGDPNRVVGRERKQKRTRQMTQEN